jgi:hypothetical protein
MHAKIRAHFSAGIFAPPCTFDALAAVESALGVSLPQPLRELYLAFDGFRGPGNAQYLFPLSHCADGGSSLLAMTQLFRDWESPDLSRFIFFGSSTADECWGLSLDDSRRIIAYHHHMEAEYEIAGSDIYEAYIADEQRYRQVTPP